MDINAFFWNTTSHPTAPVGYQTTGIPEKLSYTFKLTPPTTQSHPIYYFPYKTDFPGYCIPRDTNHPIITGGMNGCSIDIYNVQRDNATLFIFIHNANEKQLNQGNTREALFATIRTQLSLNEDAVFNLYARIRSSDYMSLFTPEAIGNAYWLPIIKQISPGLYDAYFFCCTHQRFQQLSNDGKFVLHKEHSKLIRIQGPGRPIITPL